MEENFDIFQALNLKAPVSPDIQAKAESIKILCEALLDVTEFSPRELLALSVLKTNPYVFRFLENYVKNKKQVKRKHAPEILKALKYLSNMNVSQMPSQNSDIGRIIPR